MGKVASGEGIVSKSAVDIVSVSKIFLHRLQPVTALDAVSFDIRDREFFTLLGPSGCGKTTLLRIIAGFEDITKGQVLLYGDDISTLAPHQRPVNTVFQQYALFPHLSVYENVAFGLKRLGQTGNQINSRARAMLELIRMVDFADRRPHELSGGQQQRVALARALAPAPKVLLLDEPLSALDLKLRQAMREELKAIQKQTGITFVFVTHDQEEALAMSDRIAVMSNGKVQQIGTPQDIYNNPVNNFVANFIGEANIIEAVAEPGHGTTARLMFNGWKEKKIDLGRKIAGPEDVSFMIRPEQISIRPARGNPPSSGSCGRIEDMSYLGTDTQYHIVLDKGQLVLARIQNVSVDTAELKVGDAVHVDFPDSSIRVLAK